MDGPVKARRYDASGRRAASAATRQRVVDAARALMVERGFRATTVAAIAERADVNVDTVYALVGRKPAILRELIEQAVSGTDRAVVAEQRAHVQAMLAEPDPAKKLAIYARAVRETQVRLAPLFLALRDAASTEPDARRIWHEISDRRAANMRKLVADVAASGHLREGLDIGEAADMVWLTNSSEAFVMLTGERGWSLEQYERWLVDTWCRLLLDG